MSEIAAGSVQERDSHVTYEIGKLKDQINRLEKVCETIHLRLVAVVREAPDLESDPQVAEVIVPLAGDIRLLQQRIADVCNRFDTLLDRIEI